jgi:hypothetical protein
MPDGMRGLPALLVLAAAAVLTAVSAAAPANPPRKVIRAAVQARAVRIAIGVFDLPGTGWSAEPPSQASMAWRCSYYDPDQSRLTENGAYSVGYSRDDGLYISSTVDIFASATEGRAAYAAVAQPLSARCLGEASARSSQPPGSVRLRSAVQLVSGRFGDRSIAFRLVFSSKQRRRAVRTTLDVLDVWVINRGAANAMLTFGNAREESVERRVVARVAARMAA